jgi:exopolysaccharide biosynthesis WecB/TagA/CpsF family protein
MKILLCHNHYRQAGGEDRAFLDEGLLLEARGHEVLRFALHNDDIPRLGRFHAGRRMFWNREVYRQLRELIRRERPQVMHCTNIFPLISPAAYDAARREGVAVVQSLHNYRLLCANALLMRNGRACEDCLGRRFPWPCVLHGCYRGSRLGTAAVAAMNAYHRLRGTWTSAVDRYIVLSEFARRKFFDHGLPPEKLIVKPNFVCADSGPGDGAGDYAVFVGRLSEEKGVATLLAAWDVLGGAMPLRIVGEGPLAPQVQAAATRNAAIEWLGPRPFDEVLYIIGAARCLIVPSVCYETFGRTIIEAYACGTPVIASRLGAMEELVEHHRTGLHFAPGDAADLAAAVRQFLADPDAETAMRRTARQRYEDLYTPDRNYEMLMDIYEQAIACRAGISTDCGAGVSPAAAAGTAAPQGGATAGWFVGQVGNLPHEPRWPPKRSVFGVGVSVTNYDEAVATIVAAGRRRDSAVVSLLPVQGLVMASNDPQLQQATNSFELVAPDGQPVRWALNLLHRTRLRDRVCGSELMSRLCQRAAEERVPIYLYGGEPAVLEALQAKLAAQYPKLPFAGVESPPFRPLTPEEDEAAVERINRSGAGLVFLGLGYPKQDYYAHAHRARIRGVQLCVGAAFDFLSGNKRRAPAWMQRCGLEWLSRLCQEPRRLWRRYLVYNALYLCKLAAALFRRAPS